jgi:hypothetical protein
MPNTWTLTMVPWFTQLLTEISTRKYSFVVERDRCIRLRTPLPYINQCGILKCHKPLSLHSLSLERFAFSIWPSLKLCLVCHSPDYRLCFQVSSYVYAVVLFVKPFLFLHLFKLTRWLCHKQSKCFTNDLEFIPLVRGSLVMQKPPLDATLEHSFNRKSNYLWQFKFVNTFNQQNAFSSSQTLYRAARAHSVLKRYKARI